MDSNPPSYDPKAERVKANHKKHEPEWEPKEPGFSMAAIGGKPKKNVSGTFKESVRVD
jgi:hypothetical protein